MASICNASATEGRASTITGEGATKRLFELLDAEGQERVVVLKTKYEQLMSLERAAFLQELGLISTRDIEEEAARRATRGKLSRYASPRLTAVQDREVGYVVMQQEPTAAPDEPPFQDAEDLAAAEAQRRTTVGQPMSDLALRRLLTNEMFGDGDVSIRPERKSLYEKIGALEGEEEESAKAARASVAQAAEETLRRKSMMAPKASSPIGEPGSYAYRSNAYQAVRLALSFPGRINMPSVASEDPALASTTVNVTGMPIRENELREWFDAMDSNGSGVLDCNEFMSFMRSLERDFGVADAYAQLERDGQKLALDNKLSFEAFAYLVMRFARE